MLMLMLMLMLIFIIMTRFNPGKAGWLQPGGSFVSSNRRLWLPLQQCPSWSHLWALCHTLAGKTQFHFYFHFHFVFFDLISCPDVAIHFHFHFVNNDLISKQYITFHFVCLIYEVITRNKSSHHCPRSHAPTLYNLYYKAVPSVAKLLLWYSPWCYICNPLTRHAHCSGSDACEPETRRETRRLGGTRIPEPKVIPRLVSKIPHPSSSIRITTQMTL